MLVMTKGEKPHIVKQGCPAWFRRQIFAWLRKRWTKEENGINQIEVRIGTADTLVFGNDGSGRFFATVPGRSVVHYKGERAWRTPAFIELARELPDVEWFARMHRLANNTENLSGSKARREQQRRAKERSAMIWALLNKFFTEDEVREALAA